MAGCCTRSLKPAVKSKGMELNLHCSLLLDLDTLGLVN
jgi:hypothetical protein